MTLNYTKIIVEKLGNVITIIEIAINKYEVPCLIKIVI